MGLLRRLSLQATRLATWQWMFCLSASADATDTLWTRTLGVDEGLSQNFITAIAQDRQGFLWFGTVGGLNRWNGYQFEIFTHAYDEATSLGDSVILGLHADSQGRVWIGTREGLDGFDPATGGFHRYGSQFRVPDGVSPVNPEAITSDRAGRVWFASLAGPHLYRLDPLTGKGGEYRIADTARKWVTALLVDSTDRLWVAMQTAERAGALENREYRVFVFERCSALGEDPLPSPRQLFGLEDGGGKVTTMIEDNAQRLWLGRNGGGLLRFDPRTGVTNRMAADPADSQALESGSVRSLGLGPVGELWVLTQPLGPLFTEFPDRLHRVDPETLTARRIALRQSTVRPGDDARLERLVVDHSGVLWLGSNGGGLRYADVSSGGFSLYRRGTAGTPGLNSSFVRAVCQGRDGVVWVGTPEGLNRIDRSHRQTVYSSPPSNGVPALPHPNVQAIHEDRGGNLWIGTQGGLTVVEPSRKTCQHYRHDAGDPQSLGDDYVLVVHEDRHGRIWVGTLGAGLDEFDSQTRRFTHHPSIPGDPSSLPSGTIHALFSDREDRLWVGTGAGLARLGTSSASGRRFERMAADPTALGAVAVLSIGESTATPDVLWIGTEQHGLCRLAVRDGHCRFFTRRNSGLPDDRVYGVLADRRGRLWITTNRGLTCYDPASETFRTYGPHHGLQSSEFNTRAYCQGPNGEMFFGGVGGLNAFFPEQILDNPHAPRVLITDVRVLDRRATRPDSTGNSLYRSGRAEREVGIKYWQRDVTFDYVALHYSDPANMIYQYQLEGFDPDWQDLVTQRRARYTNLEPGRYAFRVKARSSHGVWSAEEARFSFRIQPPFHATAWFRTLVTLASFSAAAGVYRWRVGALHRRQQVLERQVDHRTQELQRMLATVEEQAEKLKQLDSAKSKFFANISHEFRTPLMLALGPLRDVHAGLHGSIPGEARAEIELAIRNTIRQLELVDQLLLLARLDGGQFDLRPRALCLNEFLRLAAAPYESLAKRQQTHFRLDLPEAPVLGTYDEGKLEHVIGNLLGNAFKYTPSGGTVTLRLGTTPDHWATIEVEDTGPGIPKPDLPHIFERFYRGGQESAGPLPGAGIGLALAKEIVDLHQGEIDAENRAAGGSRFTVRLKTDPSPSSSEAAEVGVLNSGPEPTPNLRHSTALPGGAPVGEESEEGSRPKVLVVEDHPDLRAYLRKHLAAQYQVIEATRGEEGWKAVKTEIPDVVISDVMMPGMDGYALCRAIKSDPETDFIPVILLTAKAGTQSRIEGLEGGADDYIPKPFDPTELVLRLRNLLCARARLKARFASPPAKPSLQPAPLPVKSLDDAFRDRLREVLDRESHEESFGVVTLARKLGLSRPQLHRRIKSACDSTPAEVIIRFRLDRAAQMLAQRSGTVAEIAYAVGFKNVSHFVERFRVYLHLTPSAYAEARRHELEETGSDGVRGRSDG